MYTGEHLSIPDGTLRLSGEDSYRNGTQGFGRLEISYYGVWMTVCGTYFSDAAAEVSCRQLGYTAVVNVCKNSSWYVSWIDDHYRLHVPVYVSTNTERLNNQPSGVNCSQSCNTYAFKFCYFGVGF